MRKILVLMATYNGARFVADQLESIRSQDGCDVDMLVSDDGSSDGTQGILADFADRWNIGSFSVIDGPRQGNAGENFAHLFRNLPETVGYLSLADQDDVWHPKKFERALDELENVPANIPAVACSRTRLIDSSGIPYGYSRFFRKPPSFSNAVVQSLAGGNTMVLNPAASRLVRQSYLRGVSVPAHDWWIYMLVTGAGGRMLYREQWDTLYRQHSANVVGDNQGWLARLFRIRQLLGGSFRDWNEANERALITCRDLLNDEGQKVLADFGVIRRATLPARLARFWTSRIYRQSLGGQCALIVACILKLV